MINDQCYVLQAYVLEFPRDDERYAMVTGQLEEIVRRLTPQVSQGWQGDEFVPVYLLATIGNLIETIHIELAGRRLTDLIDRINIPALDEEALRKRQSLLETAVSLADEVSYLVLQTQVANEEPFSINTGYFSAQGKRVKNTNIKPHFEDDGYMVKYPVDLLENLPQDEVFQIVSTVAMNPFIWGYDDGQHVTSQVVSVSFTYSNGDEVHLQDLPEDQRISIAMQRGLSYYNSQRTDLSQMRQYAYRGKRSTSSASTPRNQVTDDASSSNSTRGETLVTVLELSAGQTLSSVLNTSYGISGGGGVIVQLKSQIQGTSGNASTVNPSLTAYIGKRYVPHKFKYRALLNLNHRSPRHDDSTVYSYVFLDIE